MYQAEGGTALWNTFSSTFTDRFSSRSRPYTTAGTIPAARRRLTVPFVFSVRNSTGTSTMVAFMTQSPFDTTVYLISSIAPF